MLSRPTPHIARQKQTHLQSLLWGLLLVLPWVAPWSPGPQANTVPLLISWGCIGLLLVLGQGIHAIDIVRAWAIAALIRLKGKEKAKP